MAILLPRARCQCKCHGNHREFVVERDDALMWGITFDEWQWETKLCSIADKASGQQCAPAIVEALVALKTRLGMFGFWWHDTTGLKLKLRKIGICWRCPRGSKPENCFVQLACQECNRATVALQILSNRDHCPSSTA